MTFDYLPVRLRFTALDPIRFPAGKAGNSLRGALGMEAPESLFRPAGREAGPSGFADPPRPFVLRPRELDGRAVAEGQEFGFALHLFDLAIDLEELTNAFDRIAHTGLGVGRGRASLHAVTWPDEPVRLSLQPASLGCEQAAIRFLSPTELKPPGDPEFEVVLARARDRVSGLRAVYGPGPVEVDHKALGDRSRAIRMTRCDVTPVALERRSTRTGQVHPIGGFVGTAEYEGCLDEFLPWLLAAEATGIGRHTVWGNGEIRVAYPMRV